MKYLSVCSGIEAASVAWHSLGWTPLAFSEIEKFPSQVLAHHYPNTPNFGDMTKFKEWSIESDVNVLVGGTPCQSFSVAGLRKGLDDPRGNLMLTYLAIAAKYRPRWLVWENVPGVLSSNGGLDFASLLRGMGECGYGFAYRILDAQYFGVAQRRRRVFVVGYLGNWRPAAAVLFERHSLQGHPAPSREKGQGTSATITARTGVSRNNYEECLSTYSTPAIGSVREDSLSSCITKNTGGGGESQNPAFVLQPIALQDVRAVEKMQNGKGWNDDGTAYTVDTHATQGVAQPIPFRDTADCLTAAYGTKWNGNASADNGSLFVAQPIAFAQNTRDEVRLMNGDGSIIGALAANPGMKQTCYIAQPIPFDTTQITSKANYSKPQAGDPCHPLAAGAHPPAICLMDQGGSVMTIENDITGTLRRETHGHEPVVMQPIAFDMAQITSKANGSRAEPGLPTGTLAKGSSMHVAQAMAFPWQSALDPIGNPVNLSGTLVKNQTMAVAQPIGLDEEQNAMVDAFGTLKARTAGGGFEGSVMQTNMAVRRLTPVECERLQGFPDNYTDIQPKGKATPDGPRYKALGNSMAVPVMAWIGERIAQVEAIHAS